MNIWKSFLLLVCASALVGCAARTPDIPVNYGSAEPGGTVTRGGTPLDLLGTPVRVGEALPSVVLYDNNLRAVNLADKKGGIMVVSVVPSVDTGVCEQQTHLLGDWENPGADIELVTVSRDLPFAQKRFREATGYDHILFLSDYQSGEFGRETGLLVDEIKLLARTVMVVDEKGIVRYQQVVPEIGNLPICPGARRRALIRLARVRPERREPWPVRAARYDPVTPSIHGRPRPDR